MALVPNADTPYSMYPTAREDADGNPLDRAHCYQILDAVAGQAEQLKMYLRTF